MNERVVIVDSSPSGRDLLNSLIASRIDSVRIDAVADIGELIDDHIAPDVVVHNSLRPGAAGELRQSDRDALESVQFQSAGILAVSSAFLEDTVFYQSIVRLSGPPQILTFRKKRLGWGDELVTAIQFHIRRQRYRALWNSFFPDQRRAAGSGAPDLLGKTELTTRLTLLKRELEDRESVEAVPDRLILERFMLYKTQEGREICSLIWDETQTTRRITRPAYVIHTIPRIASNDRRLTDLAEGIDRIIERLEGDPFRTQFNRHHPVAIHVTQHLNLARVQPIFEIREDFESIPSIFVTQDVFESDLHKKSLYILLARAALRESRPKPCTAALVFEEALAHFYIGKIVGLRDERIDLLQPGLSIDAPGNINGISALLHFVWNEMGSHLPSKLWAAGADGLLHALNGTFARPAYDILRRFFLWALSQELLGTPSPETAPTGKSWAVLDRASFWFGRPPSDMRGILHLAVEKNHTVLYSFLVPYSRDKVAPLPSSTSNGRDALLVMNCGHRAASGFPSDDAQPWRLSHGEDLLQLAGSFPERRKDTYRSAASDHNP